MPLLRDYVAEHERVVNLGGAAVRALDRGDPGRAGALLAAMSQELAAHWQGEEDGLFAVMRRDELFSQHIAPLVQEHRELAILLASVDLSDPEDQDRLRRAVDDLHEHIAKEEDGLFPASLTALGGEDWDAAMAAWQQAHPDRSLIADAHGPGFEPDVKRLQTSAAVSRTRCTDKYGTDGAAPPGTGPDTVLPGSTRADLLDLPDYLMGRWTTSGSTRRGEPCWLQDVAWVRGVV